MTEARDMGPRSHYAAAMDQGPRVDPGVDLAALVAALAAPQMFDCTRFPGATRISERQCLVNQERAAAGGFPSFCRDCPEGREIKARHPEGVEVKIRPLNLAGAVNRPLEMAREQAERRAAMVKPKAAATPTPALPPQGGGGESAAGLIFATTNEVAKINTPQKNEAEVGPDLPKRAQNIPENIPAVPAAPAEKKDMSTVQVSEKEAGKILRPERLKEIMAAPGPASEEGEGVAENLSREAPRCPRHPEEPQVQSKPGGRNVRHYLGRCKIWGIIYLTP